MSGRKEDSEKLTQAVPAEVKQEVKDKIARIDQVGQQEAPMPARAHLKRRIIMVMKQGMAEYYAHHPERATDQRSHDAEDYSIHGIQAILRLIDEYQISYKPDGNSNPSEKTGGS